MKLESMEDDLFRLAVESSPAAMIVTGQDGAIQFANAETSRMFGYQPQELIGQTIDVLVPTRLRPTHLSLRQGFLANPSKRPMGIGRDLKATRRDGSEFPVEIGLTPIKTLKGILVLATVLDISARREADLTLAQRAFELERANERLAQFAFIASHDLQEPLRKIAAFSDHPRAGDRILEQIGDGACEPDHQQIRVTRPIACRRSAHLFEDDQRRATIARTRSARRA